jgi:hypothetical protein
MAGVEVVSPFSVVVAARDSRRAYASVIALVALAAAVVCVAVLTSGSGGDRFTALAQRHLGSGAPSARMPPTVCAHLIAGQTAILFTSLHPAAVKSLPRPAAAALPISEPLSSAGCWSGWRRGGEGGREGDGRGKIGERT